MEYITKPKTRAILPKVFNNLEDITTTAKELYKRKSKFVHIMYKYDKKSQSSSWWLNN